MGVSISTRDSATATTTRKAMLLDHNGTRRKVSHPNSQSGEESTTGVSSLSPHQHAVGAIAVMPLQRHDSRDEGNNNISYINRCSMPRTITVTPPPQGTLTSTVVSPFLPPPPALQQTRHARSRHRERRQHRSITPPQIDALHLHRFSPELRPPLVEVVGKHRMAPHGMPVSSMPVPPTPPQSASIDTETPEPSVSRNDTSSVVAGYGGLLVFQDAFGD